MRRGFSYWAMNLIHNLIIHPLLPFADMVFYLNWKRPADFIYELHDITTPSLYLEISNER